jgi:PBP1b-binding outer membrane lipoprotein LpoB
MLSKKTWAVMLAAVAVLMMSGCATDVKRMGIEEVKDLSGNWNDTDSRLVSDEMIKDSLSGAWIDRHEQKNNNKAPAVIVGNIRNLSHEHINTRTFIADLERAYVNSGRIDVVASKAERDGIREERADMDLNASEESRKEMGKETGADYMLIGSINSIIDASGGEQIRFYQVDLTLVSILDNRKVWTGQKKLKKDVKEAKFR